MADGFGCPPFLRRYGVSAAASPQGSLYKALVLEVIAQGKHVITKKSIALKHAEAKAMYDAAQVLQFTHEVEALRAAAGFVYAQIWRIWISPSGDGDLNRRHRFDTI